MPAEKPARVCCDPVKNANWNEITDGRDGSSPHVRGAEILLLENL